MRKVLRFIARSASILVLLAASFPISFAGADDVLVHHRVSTTHADAQREFDEGLTMMYAFNPEEASFHFERAIDIDPALTMGYWGVALASGPNINTDYDLARARIGREAIALARRSASHASTTERAYVEALAPRYDGVVQPGQIAAAQKRYADAMVALAARFPADVDAQTLAAESLMDLTPLHMWNRDGSPTTYTKQVIALLQGVLRRDPGHIGANHLLIHAYEDSATPGAALPAARRLAAEPLPPGAEHLAHMSAHIFTRVGDWDGAIAANLKAIAMFRQYLPQEHSGVHNAYYHHDYQVMNYAYMMSGQWSNAHAAAIQIANQVGDNAAGVETYVRFHKWPELLALTPPAAPDLRWRFAHAMASASTGNRADADATIAWIDGLHDRDPRTAIARASIRAAIAIHDNQDAVAIGQLRGAVALQDGLPSREPPAWYYPIRETLGARLLLTGHAAEAERVFADDLRRNPNNPRSLFGLAQATSTSDPHRAASSLAAYRRAWAHADAPLTLQDL